MYFFPSFRRVRKRAAAVAVSTGDILLLGELEESGHRGAASQERRESLEQKGFTCRITCETALRSVVTQT